MLNIVCMLMCSRQILEKSSLKGQLKNRLKRDKVQIYGNDSKKSKYTDEEIQDILHFGKCLLPFSSEFFVLPLPN
jgi:hypothetical protein